MAATESRCGSLFASEFLSEAVRELPAWKDARRDLASGLESELRTIRRRLPAKPGASEQVTADEFIWKVLFALGWTETLREQNLSLRGRRDIPDGLLFLDEAAKTQALGVRDESLRYRAGVCLVESKRWNLGLDRTSGAQRVAPATQMLRYLREARTATGGRLRWGILSNGARWRLYHTEARSVSGEFFEVDLETALAEDGRTATLFAPPDEERLNLLTLFLSRGDLNLYSLFVERAMALVNPEGTIGLLVPSGIASDKTAAPFFRSVAAGGRLRALYDFENRKVFFPAVHASFKFCVFVAARSGRSEPARCAFYLRTISELEDRRLELTPEDFRRVNPNTGTAPIFRSRRDQEITTAIYRRLPVLVDRSSGEAVRAWPIRYSTMFHMTNDSGRFRTRAELEEKEGAWRVEGNLYDGPSGSFVPLYEGKMVQAFDHRAASVVVNPENRYRPGVAAPASLDQHRNPDWAPEPQFWISEAEIPADRGYALGFKDVTATTNIRTMIAALIPRAGAGNTLPLVLSEKGDEPPRASFWALAVSNLNAIVLDFIARQKVQAQHLNWFIVEQLPVVPPEMFETFRFGPKRAADIIREAVLELTYAAHDMAPFARALGHTSTPPARSARPSCGTKSAACAFARSSTRCSSTSTESPTATMCATSTRPSRSSNGTRRRRLEPAARATSASPS